MIFSSDSFFIFLLSVLGIYVSCNNPAQRSFLLLLASLIFYASWKPIYLILLIGSLILNYYIYCHLIEKSSKLVLSIGIISNLMLLGIFKYTGLFLETWVWINLKLEINGISTVPQWVNWSLPLGISFFTFQMLSALIDVYRGQWNEKLTFGQWCLYVSFFPQFIAGPIARANELVDQLLDLQPLRWINLRTGSLLFAGGLIKKTLFADNLAPITEALYSQPNNLDFTMSWVATLAFAMQIYFDFSGYSEMAIGLGRMFGIRLPRNFQHPYLSRSCSEFWHRWHMTLSRWLRDYLFIPLGGSRCSATRTAGNLLVTMLLGGLWHGAGWNFVFWGFIHGMYLVLHRQLKAFYDFMNIDNKWILRYFIEKLSIPLTFCLICFTWVFFRVESLNDAWTISKAMLGVNENLNPPPDVRLYQNIIILASIILVALEPTIEKIFIKRFRNWKYTPFYLRGLAYASIALTVHIFGGTTQKFIYFDF